MARALRRRGDLERDEHGGPDSSEAHDVGTLARDEHGIAGAGRGGDRRFPLTPDPLAVERLEGVLAEERRMGRAPGSDLDVGDGCVVARDRWTDGDVCGLGEQCHGPDPTPAPARTRQRAT